MTKNDQILLACCRVAQNDASLAKIKALLAEDGLDWEALILQASRHKVLPLLFLNLKRCCRQVIPPHIWEQLKTLYVSNGVRNLYLAYILTDLVRLFRKHEITAVPFKGPTLTLTAYGNLALRNFLDLDILIKKKDVAKATALLQAAGLLPELALDGPRLGAYAEVEDNLSFCGDNGMVTVELHWELSGRYLSQPIYLESLIPNLDTVSLRGEQIPALSQEVQLVYLTIHGAKHGWDCLDWICCLAELLRSQPELNWQEVVRFGRETGALQMLLIGLHLANDVLGAPLPEQGIIANLLAGEDRAKRLAAQVVAEMFAPAGSTQNALVGKRFGSWHLQCRDSWLDGLRYFLRLYLTPTVAEWQWLRLPGALSFLYYPLRPLRLGVEFMSKLLG